MLSPASAKQPHKCLWSGMGTHILHQNTFVSGDIKTLFSLKCLIARHFSNGFYLSILFEKLNIACSDHWKLYPRIKHICGASQFHSSPPDILADFVWLCPWGHTRSSVLKCWLNVSSIALHWTQMLRMNLVLKRLEIVIWDFPELLKALVFLVNLNFY